MPARLRIALTVLVACAAAAVVAVALAARGPADRPPSTAGTGYAGALRPPGLPASDFALHDETGRPVSLHDYRGQVVAVTFMYTTCKDTCPLIADQLRIALDELGRPVPVLAISVDPRNDTPERAKSFLLKHQLSGRMRYLLGSRPQLTRAWREFAVAPQTTRSGHTAYVVLVDRRGRQRVGFAAGLITPQGLAHDIRKLQA